MSTQEAKDYVDLIIESLVEKGFITEQAYGRMSASLSEELAEKIVARSEE